MVFVPQETTEEEERRRQGEAQTLSGGGILGGGGAVGGGAPSVAGPATANIASPNLAALTTGGQQQARNLASEFAQQIVNRGVGAQEALAAGLERFGTATEEATFREDPDLVSRALGAPIEFLGGERADVERLIGLREAEFGGLGELSQRRDFGEIQSAFGRSRRDIEDIGAVGQEFLAGRGGRPLRAPPQFTQGIVKSAQQAVGSLDLAGRLEAAGATSRGLAEAGRATTEATRATTREQLGAGISKFQTDLEAATEAARTEATGRFESAQGLFQSLGGEGEGRSIAGQPLGARGAAAARQERDLTAAGVPSGIAQVQSQVTSVSQQVASLEQQAQQDQAELEFRRSSGEVDPQPTTEQAQRIAQFEQLSQQEAQLQSQVQAFAGAAPINGIEATDQQLADLGLSREEFAEIQAPKILQNFSRVANFYGQADMSDSESINLAFQATFGDASRFITGGDISQITPQTFATPKQFAQFQALKFLVNQPENAFLFDASVAGTANLDVTGLDTEALDTARIKGLDVVGQRVLGQALARTSSGRKSKKRRRRKRLARFLGGSTAFADPVAGPLDPEVGLTPQAIFDEREGRGFSAADVKIPSGGFFSSGVGKFLSKAAPLIPLLPSVLGLPALPGIAANIGLGRTIQSEAEKLGRPSSTTGVLQAAPNVPGIADPSRIPGGPLRPGQAPVTTDLEDLLRRIEELRLAGVQ